MTVKSISKKNLRLSEAIQLSKYLKETGIQYKVYVKTKEGRTTISVVSADEPTN